MFEPMYLTVRLLNLELLLTCANIMAENVLKFKVRELQHIMYKQTVIMSEIQIATHNIMNTALFIRYLFESLSSSLCSLSLMYFLCCCILQPTAKLLLHNAATFLFMQTDFKCTFWSVNEIP